MTSIEDVDLRLIATRNELAEEDSRLWEGLDAERVSRIAGDDSNKQTILQVQEDLSGTERRLSTEVIDRSQGDVNTLNSLSAIAQALSDYRIKTDLEIANEQIVRQQLGVDLDTKINNFVASFDHEKHLIYQTIQDVQLDVDGKYSSLDRRVKKYENMLQDITMDSIQITMDNGEINMGAWTILSQAREWDLEIWAKVKDFQTSTTTTIDEALNDFQNNLPIKEDIINSVMEEFGNSNVVKQLDQRILENKTETLSLSQRIDDNATKATNDLINTTGAFNDLLAAESEARRQSILGETEQRVIEIQREAAIRQQQIKNLDDGLTTEYNARIDGDQRAYDLIETLKASSDTSLAAIQDQLTVQASDIQANTESISHMGSSVQTAINDSGEALTNSSNALNQVNTLATQVGTNTESINTLSGKVQDTTSGLEALGTSVNEINIKLENIGDGDIGGIATKLDALEVIVSPKTKASGTWKASSATKAATSWSLRYAQVEGDRVVSKKTDSVSTTVGELTATVQQIMESSNGTTASYEVRVDSNGLIAGFGLYNDSTTSAFAVNADQFYVGDSASTLKKPFMVLTKPQTINGTTYPAGTWIDTAIIADATIGTAHIKDASITNAKIDNLSADKITTGTLDADRIGANTITAEKVTIGDATNLWLNPYLIATGSRPQADRSALMLTVPQVKGNAVRLWDRDHISPYSTKIPIQVGDTIVIEYTAKQIAGTYRALQVGLAVYDDQGALGTSGLQYGAVTNIKTIDIGWYRFRRTFVVADNGSGRLMSYGSLMFHIEQAVDEVSPTEWQVGDISLRKASGGELIVNGAITAEKLTVDSLSAVSANLGTFTSTSADGSVNIINGNGITVKYPNGIVAIRIGIV